MEGHTGAVTAVAFNPDGALLATAGDDRTVRLWDPATGEAHGRPLEGHTDAVTAVAFSPDGTLLASASTDRTVQLWDLSWWDRPASDWAEAGCWLVNRNLSKVDCDQYAGGLSYERTCPDLRAGEGTPDDAPAAAYSP